MRRTTPYAALALIFTGACTLALAADEDPWVGKSRAEIEMLLGEPSKVKQSSGGGQKLVFKLVRLEEGTVPPEGIRVLSVPGVGLIGQMPKPGTMLDAGVRIGTTEMDEKGRGSGGDLEADATMEWNSDTKEITHSWEDRPAIRGKVTLKFEVNDEGTIERWSVSPKKAASGS